jgi:tRNA-2-methylthio-N6-dimethylallyladenosine synthase
MNFLESQKIAGQLEGIGYSYAPDKMNADYVVLNTCAVRETAERKIYGTIGLIKKYGKSGVKIAVGGCVTQVKGKEIYDRYKQVDIIFGSRNKEMLPQFFESADKGKRILNLDEIVNEDIEYALSAKRDSKYSAFVEIMKGCNNFCSYCIVPYARGREISIPPDNIKDKIVGLIDKGYKEFTLLGQNVNSYGKKFTDDKDRNYRFLDLLNDLEGINGIYRLRFITSHPKDFSFELADLMATSNIIAHSLHLPIQSGSNKILKLMNRGYSKEDYIEKISYLRSKIPDIALSTDMIFGFPSEDERDFLESIDILKKINYQIAFLFQFSVRTGTAAAKMEEKFIDNKTKLERLQYAIDFQNKISYERSKNYIGNIEDLLFYSSDKTGKKLMGRDTHNMIVVADGKKKDIGNIKKVKINDGNSYTLFGSQLNE